MDREELKKQKREEAENRQNKYDVLTITEKVGKLDKKLGKGVGATKQRKKLELALAKQRRKENG